MYLAKTGQIVFSHRKRRAELLLRYSLDVPVSSRLVPFWGSFRTSRVW